MKTKSFLLTLCLFAGAAILPLSAQKSDRTINTWETSPYYTYVYCDGNLIDYLVGTVDLHLTRHFDKNGNLVWEKYHFKGEALGFFGETFNVMEFDKYDAGTGVYSWRYHLKGDEGSHYIGTITITSEGEWIIGNTVCH